MAENIPDRPKHAGSFTNDPNLKGQIDPDTGKEWIYTPDESYWRDYKKDPVTHPEITMEDGRAIIETPKGGYAGSTAALPQAMAQRSGIPSRPPEGAKGPNYTDRTGFEQQVFKKIGGNPFTTDVMAEVNKSYTQSFPEIYNKFFRGKVTWADQGKMTKDQIEEANVLRNRYRAYLHDRITSTLKAKQNDYTMMMQRFDHEAAVVKASKERLTKEQKEMRKAPTLKPMLNEKGKWTYHQWEDGRWVDTGKGAKAPEKLIKGAVFTENGKRIVPWYNEQGDLIKKTEVSKVKEEPPKPPTPTEIRMTAKDVANAEETILTNLDNESVKGQIGLFNQYAKKPYCYLMPEKEVRKWKGIDWLAKDVGGEVGKIKLPKIKGKQVYAKDVWDTAQQHGITYEEVLKRIGAIK